MSTIHAPTRRISNSVCAGIFAAGAVICGVLLRRGPLTRPQGAPTREPAREAAATRP